APRKESKTKKTNTHNNTRKRKIKKNTGHISKKVTDDEIISLIDQENDQYPVHTLCEVLEVPRSTYYQSLTKTVSNRDKENQQLTNRILEIYHESKRRYGAPKIHYLLNQE